MTLPRRKQMVGKNTLAKASQAMLDAVKALSNAPGIDWSNPVFASVALAHADQHDALAKQS